VSDGRLTPGGSDEAPAARLTVWSDRWTSAALFSGLLLVYAAVYVGAIQIYDTQSMMGVTVNLVNHGSLTSSGAGFLVNTRYAPYGIADSLLAVPLYALSKVTGNFPGLESMISPILTALSAVLIFRIARALRWRASYGLIAAVGYGLLSMALWYSTQLLSEQGVTLCMLVIVLGLVLWRQGAARAPLWVGLGAAWAIQFRSDSMVTVWIALAATPLFVPWRVLWARRPLVLFLGPVAVSLAGLAWYNELRFHRLFVSSYGGDGGFKTPLWHGLDGLLLSPGRSLFLYSPLTVMGVAGLVVLAWGPGRVRDRPLCVLGLLLTVPRTLFFAKWDVWDGAAAWGPRFLLPVVAVLSLMIVPVLEATDRQALVRVPVRVVTALLAAAGGAVSFLSVRVPLGEWLGLLANPYWRKIYDISGASATYDFRQKTSPLWGYVELMQRHMADVSGRWWTSGHGVVGWVLAGAGGVVLAAAAYGSRRRPVPVRRRGRDGADTPDGVARAGPTAPAPADRAAPAPATVGGFFSPPAVRAVRPAVPGP